jgi:hypothetical protein
VNPSGEVTQCACCLGRRRLKTDGTFYAHDRGGRVKVNCPGSGLTPEEAKAHRALEKRQGAHVESGRQDSVRPEDIF